MTTTEFADGLRIATLVLGAGTLAVALVVVLRYWQAYTRHRQMTAEGRAAAWRGLLPRHVVTVGLSYIILLMVAMSEVIALFGAEITWRAPVYLAACALGLWAMWDLLGHQRHRKLSLCPPRPNEPWESQGE